jgi:phosphoribosyl 1,2-cyclic phosphate phosphodiesterase
MVSFRIPPARESDGVARIGSDHPVSGPPQGLRAVFLGSSGAIQIPSFLCACPVCEDARNNPCHRRTRASLAVIGAETVLIDASPDIDSQLERERIRKPDRIFITHWHSDHVGGLGGLRELSELGHWGPLPIYVPEQAAFHFDRELAYLRRAVQIRPVRPGDVLDLPDASWEVVKTTHNEHSVGFIVRAGQSFAYLVDGIVPPPATLARLSDVDILILEATVDDLDEAGWTNFTLSQAIDFWRGSKVPRCVLTHLSCHGWKGRRLVPGLTPEQRGELESQMEGLTFAYDGLVVPL